MSKVILQKEAAKEKVIRGINILANTVKATLGPNGRFVILDKNYGNPTVTNDGVTIAKSISLRDKGENIGAKLLIEASEKTDQNVGDGTTTTALLVQVLVNEGQKNILAGRNPFQMIKGMELARDQVLASVEKSKKLITTDQEIVAVASISSKDEKIGALIAEVIKKVGKDGRVTIEKGSKFETEISVIEGIHFDEGFAAPFMVTDKKNQTAEYSNAHVLVYDGKVDSIRLVLKLLEETMKEGVPLVIIASEFSDDFLATILVNTIQGGISVLAIKAPGFGQNKSEELEDVAIYLGTKVYNSNDKLDTLTLAQLGITKTIKTTKNQTILIGGNGKKADIAKRVEMLRTAIANADGRETRLEERLAKLTGGIGVVKVGAATESELESKKLRFEDALNSTLAAFKNGVVEGGGLALLKASQSIVADKKMHEDVQIGQKIVRDSLREPVRQIAVNSGFSGDVTLSEIEKHDFKLGLNAVTGEYVDMFKVGIIDPTNVVRNIITNAVSIASLVLITEAIIFEEEKDEPAKPSLPGYGA